MYNQVYTFKADEAKISKMIEFYDYCHVTTTDKNIVFRAATHDFSIQIYQNNTVLIQGLKAINEYAIWYNIDTDYFSHIGSDEVGTGDYFGPIIVCACLVKDTDYDYLKELGVKDSKELSDKKIIELVPKIVKRVKCKISILSNTKYNEIYSSQKYSNLNKMKAYLHNFLITKLKEETKFEGPAIVDQFCDKELFYNYLKDYKATNITNDIDFYIKAENKFLAVACASIIARYEFLKRLDDMSKKLNKTILKGAGAEVDALALAIAKEHGIDALKEYVKFNFENTKKIIKQLEKK